MQEISDHGIPEAGLGSGWPLGLHLLGNAGISSALSAAAIAPETVHFRLSDSTAYLVSATPSITSDSSSDLDTESTASFFPEKSTTLGSLIGLQSKFQTQQTPARVPVHQLIQEDRTLQKRRSAGGSGIGTSMSRGGRALCPLLSCGSAGLQQEERMGMSPSLAHLLEKERRSISGFANALEHANTLFDNEGVLPPPPSGAPLRLMLQQPHADATYLSSDWHVFHNKDHANHSHGLWPSLCFKQTTNLAN